MNKKMVLLVTFLALALAQLYVPAKMIINKEEVLERGKEFKFSIEPVDPYDPFRGKYITLRFRDRKVMVTDGEDWKINDPIYVILEVNEEGFAIPKFGYKETPEYSDFFIEAKVDGTSYEKENFVWIDYPFDRYYMEESKAYDAELAYRNARRDSSQDAYALVSVKNGDAALKNVYINEIPIVEYINQQREEEQEKESN